MSKIKGEISRRQLLKMASPLGKVTLEKDRCTGCGLCALECPSGALVFTQDSEAVACQLLFKHSLCVACGQCVEICPEQCLHLERALEPEGLHRPATVLFEDEIVRCAECGCPLASRAMINGIKAKLPATGRVPSSQLELCPGCKAKVQFSRMGS